MKLPTLPVLLTALSAQGVVQAQPVAVNSEPLGYTTTNLSGSFANGSRKNNFVSPSLVNPVSWRGTVASIAGEEVVLSGAALTAGAFNATSLTPLRYAYYVQTGDGFWSHIVSNTNGALTLPPGTAAQLTAGEAVTIRRHITITDYLGNNEVGLRSSATGVVSQADRVLIANPDGSGNTTIIASSANGGVWITENFEDAANFPIYPDQGVQISRTLPGDLTLETTGRVETTERQIQVNAGTNIVPVVSPVATTLAKLGLHTGDAATGVVGNAEGISSRADTVSVTIDGVTSIYFYSTADLGGGAGWYDEGLVFSDNKVIPAGASIVIKRKNPVNAAPFIWKSPAPEIQ